MEIEKGRIDFSKMPHEKRQLVQEIADHPLTYKEHVGKEEKLLFDAYIKHFFFQISKVEYDQAWGSFISFLGVTPKEGGISFLEKRMSDIMKDIMYDNLWRERKIDPRPYLEMIFCQELYKTIKKILKEKHIVCFEKRTEKCDWNDSSVLYIYKGQTNCHAKKHTMESATIVFVGRNNADIKLNAEHCRECGKFFMSYSVYERYRERYGILLGKLKMDSGSVNGSQDVVLSEFSPLKLCGYSVNQQDGLSNNERHYIISKVIEKGILRKSEVVRYLEYFISRNGQKSANALALKKWKEDIDFTLKYRLSEQPKYELSYIKKY